jgi:hypothetical protein
VSASTYDAAAQTDRRPGDGQRDDRELVRLATLAASSHNTQPWRFERRPDAMLIRPDRDRRCPVVDPDDAHLYRSLGCAAENLVHAASLQQLSADVSFDDGIDAVVVRLRPSPALEPTMLSAALVTRQCTRAAFDGRPVPEATLAPLREAGASARTDCRIVTDRPVLASVADLVSEGNRRQLRDPGFRRELLDWVRFDTRAALRHRDGLAGRVNGQPPLPTILGRLLASVVIRPEAQARTDRDRILSSAGIAVFSGGRDRAAWVDVGRCFERFALQADLLDIRTAFINQPIEVPELRPQVRSLLATDGEPQLLVRFGWAPRAPYSLRRPVDEVFPP